MEATPDDSPCPFPYEPVHPDLLAWARQTLDVEKFLEEMREMEKTGGVPLEAFIGEIEARVRRPRGEG